MAGASSSTQPSWSHLPASQWAELTSASQTGALDGVPPSILAAINVAEEGGYPNTAVNSEGYGGDFGTSNGSASFLAQAESAASTFAAGLKASGGNVSNAEAYYQTGSAVPVYKGGKLVAGPGASSGPGIFAKLSGLPASAYADSGGIFGSASSALSGAVAGVTDATGGSGSAGSSTGSSGAAGGLLVKIGTYLLGGALLIVGIVVLVKGQSNGPAPSVNIGGGEEGGTEADAALAA